MREKASASTTGPHVPLSALGMRKISGKHNYLHFGNRGARSCTQVCLVPKPVVSTLAEFHPPTFTRF